MKLDYASPAVRGRRWPARFFFGTLVTLSLVAATLYVAYPRVNRGCVITYEMSCRSNLSMIGKAIMLYNNEYRGAYPPDLATLATTQDMVQSQLICPAANHNRTAQLLTAEHWTELEQSGQLSYRYLGAGKTVETVLPDEIIAWDDTCWGGTDVNVLFGDGRAEMVIRDEAKALLPLLRSGTSPVVWPPHKNQSQ